MQESHDLAYKAQVDRAFKKPKSAKTKAKKEYTEEDWLREAKAFLGKTKQKRKGFLDKSGWISDFMI